MIIPGVQETPRRRRAINSCSSQCARSSSPRTPGHSSLFTRFSQQFSAILEQHISSRAPAGTCDQELKGFTERPLSSATTTPDVRHRVAMAARNRLHERLRAADLGSRRTPYWSGTITTPDSVGNEDEMTGNRLTERLSGKNKDRKLKLRERKWTPKMQLDTGSDVEEFDECPVCLDRYESGQIVVTLPCKHRFHSDCLIPWLEAHHHCPFCRTTVSDKPLFKAFPADRK